MSDPVFLDKAAPPSDADLAAMLGPAAAAWQRIVTDAAAICPNAKPAWKHYAGKYGWVFLFRDKKRNLMYLSPREKAFVASLALSEAGVAAAEESTLPEAVKEQIREAPKYPEGRAVRVTVTSPRQAATVVKLLALKCAS